MYTVEAVLDDIQEKTTVQPGELGEAAFLLTEMKTYTKEAGIPISHNKAVIIGIHLIAFMGRVERDEYLPDLDESIFEEVSPDAIKVSRRLLEQKPLPLGRKLDAAEIFYLTVHFEAAKLNQEE
jgi:PRD domain protein (TIGR03582 family)